MPVSLSSERSAGRVSVFVALLLGMLLGAAAPAQAADPTAAVTGFFAGPVTAAGACSPTATATATTAGSRSDFCVAFSTKSTPEVPATGDDLKSEIIDTPVGFAGAPTNVDVCTDAQFNYASNTEITCPLTSQVGEVRADVRLAFGGVELPLSGVPGRVFNLPASNNEAARLGIILDTPSGDKQKILVRVTLRPAPDVGLRSIIDDLPRSTNLLGTEYPIAVDAFSLRFWGSKADHPTMPGDFGLIGSDCSTDQRSDLSATSYDGATSSRDAAPYRLTDCANVPFTPSIAIATDSNAPDTTTASTVSVKFADYQSPRTSATVKKTIVTLPPGLSFSGQIASGAAGLPLCTAEQFGQTRAETNACPPATAVGTVSFKSPLLANPLTGFAYLGSQPSPGALPDLYIQGELGTAADAPRVKLIGHLAIDDQNRVVTTLDDLPPVLVNEFTLKFRGGDQSALVTPPTCGEFQGALAAYPYSAPDTAFDAQTTYAVTDDCAAVNGFDPKIAFSSANTQAGGSGAFTTTITRPDRTQRITKTVVDLPAGVLATLRGVPECPQDVAARSACGADTKVGTITSDAGVGPAPFTARGTVYLTNRSEGAVAGISLSVPIKFGDVDLGTLAVPGRIEIRPGDLGLRLIADVPERFAGIPLNLRSISVSLDRQGFPLNPTNCGPLSTTSTLTGSGGAVANVPAGFQVTGCSALKFAPVIDAAVTGSTGNLGRPSLSVRVQSPAGGSALRQTYVTLPKGIGVDLAQLPRACAIPEFQAGGCPATAIIGKVSGALSITDERLGGSLFLLKAAPGKTLPGLGLAFTGRYAGRVVGANQVDTKTGQLVTAFDAIPDLPLTDLQIDITGGTGSPLVATKALCTADTVDFAARFVAQSGPTATQTVRTTCGTPLGARLDKTSARLGGMRKGRPTLVLTASAPAGRKIKQVDITLPTGFTLSSSRAKSSKGVAVKKLSVKGRSTSKRISSRKLRLKLPKAGSTTVRVLTRTGTTTIKSKSLRKTKKKQVVVVTVVYTDGSKGSVPVLLTPH